MSKKKTITTSLAQRVINGRIARGLTQQRLAEITGLHVSTISRIEQGRSDGDLESLSKIAAEFSMQIEHLCGLDGSKGARRG